MYLQCHGVFISQIVVSYVANNGFRFLSIFIYDQLIEVGHVDEFTDQTAEYQKPSGRNFVSESANHCAI